MQGLPTFPSRGAPVAKAAPAPAPERKALEISRSAAVFFGLTDAAGAPAVEQLVGLRTFAVSALAYICMAYRATKLVEPPLWVWEETADGERWVEGAHPLEAVLEQPNPDMDMSELLEVTSPHSPGTVTTPPGRAVLRSAAFTVAASSCPRLTCASAASSGPSPPTGLRGSVRLNWITSSAGTVIGPRVVWMRTRATRRSPSLSVWYSPEAYG